MKPGDTAEVTPALAVRRARISGSQEPWQQDSGLMDSPGTIPGPPRMGTPTLAVNSSLACGPPFPEAEARACWTHVCPSHNHPCQAQPCC